MSDALYHGPTYRTFILIHDGNREALGVEVDVSLTAGRVAGPGARQVARPR